MILRWPVILALGALLVTPQRASAVGEVAIGDDALDLPRGMILPFWRRTLIVDGLPLLTVEERIWSGQAWLPLWSRDGELLVETIRQQTRDGTIDSE